MEFNGRKIQVGDIIHVKPFLVTKTLEDGNAIATNGLWAVSFFGNQDHIERVEPGPIAVGEIVRYESGVATYNVEVLCVGETTSFVRIISRSGGDGSYLPGNEIAVTPKYLSRLE